MTFNELYLAARKEVRVRRCASGWKARHRATNVVATGAAREDALRLAAMRAAKEILTAMKKQPRRRRR